MVFEYPNGKGYRFRSHTYNWLNRLSFFISVVAFLTIVYEFGIHNIEKDTEIFTVIYLYAVFAIGFLKMMRYLILPPKKLPLIVWIFDMSFIALVLLIFVGRFFFHGKMHPFWNIVNLDIWLYILLVLIFLKKVSDLGIGMGQKRLNPALVFVLSFMILILIGTAFLLLPNATTHGISLMDALFTSTSAVCVTGLTVADTTSCFTTFGQVIILVLIQLGGIGIMTFTSFFSYFFKGKTTFHSQLMLSHITNSDKMSEIFDVFKKILILTFIIEAIGAGIIFLNIGNDFNGNLNEQIYFSVFHSISAFCNAGFSTAPDGLYNITFRFNYALHITIAFLIIFGGLGFPVILNLLKYLRHFIFNRIFKWNPFHKHLHQAWVINLNTRIVLITSIVLIVLGTLTVLLTEYNNSLSEHEGIGKIATAFFTSVTPRTAGFNTVNMGVLHVSTILILLVLMWIGASPGSTGGGIKTSTFALGILNIFSLAKGKENIEIYKRRVSDVSLRRVSAIILLSFIVIGISVFCVSAFDPDKKLLDVIFECFSAYSTVGLSLGITPYLSEPSKFIIILTMFIGRIGTLTLLIAFLKKFSHKNYDYPSENILIN